MIEGGKHVLVEKPLALNAGEAERLNDAAAAQGVMLMEALRSAFLPKFDVIRQLLADGTLGDVHTVIADHGEYFGRDHRIMRADLAGGPMLDFGTYAVALSQMVLPEPEEVQAVGEPAPSGVNGQAAMSLRHAGGGGVAASLPAAHLAACVAEGRSEAPIHPLGHTIATLRTMDRVRARLGIVF